MIHCSHRVEMSRLRSNLLFFCVTTMLLSACVNSEENLKQDPNDPTDASGQTDQQADSQSSMFTAGVGGESGFELISSVIPPGCVGYPVGDRVLLTTALCLAECVYEDCQPAVMMLGDEPRYYGLASEVVLSPLFMESDPLAANFDEGFGLVYLNRSNELPEHSLSFEEGTSVSVFGQQREVIEQSDGIGRLDEETENCPASNSAVFNDRAEIIGLSLGRRGQCNDYVALAGSEAFFDVALNLNYTQNLPFEKPEEPEVVDTEALEREEAERRWSEEETAALMNAPECGEDERSSYCEGNIELSCYGGTYRAMHCSRVGWTCQDDDIWGPACMP